MHDLRQEICIVPSFGPCKILMPAEHTHENQPQVTDLLEAEVPENAGFDV